MSEVKKPVRKTIKSKKTTPEGDDLSILQIASERENLLKSTSEKERAAESERAESILSTVSELTVTKVVREISELELHLGEALNEISRKIIEQVRQLENLREAVDLEKSELLSLHKKDFCQISIDQLLEEYHQQKLQLDKEIEQQKQTWISEKESQEVAQKEQEQLTRKLRAREEEEYNYKRNQERKRDQEQYENQKRNLENELDEKTQAFEKSWAERESLLKSKEDEFSKLKTEVELFPEKLSRDITLATTKLREEMESRHKNEVLLIRKEFEAEKKLSIQHIKSLEDSVVRQTAQIESLQQRLEQSKQQVQDIAIKAIESTSGARALSHVSQIAMEQAKPRGATP